MSVESELVLISMVTIWTFFLPSSGSRIDQPVLHIQLGVPGNSFKQVWTFNTSLRNLCLFRDADFNNGSLVHAACGQWPHVEAARDEWEEGNPDEVSHLILSCAVNDDVQGTHCACASFKPQPDRDNSTVVNEHQHDLTASHWPCRLDSMEPWTRNSESFSKMVAVLLANTGLQDLRGLQKFASLEYLQLASTDIDHRGVPADFLCGFPNLAVLMLVDTFGQNGSEFRWDLLSCSSSASVSLKAIVVTDATLTTVPTNAFQTFPKLQLLQLTDDRIDTLNADSFTGLSSLLELNLGHNHISELPAGVFAHLSQLRYLSLDHNKLRYVNVDEFSHLGQLRKLTLEQNAIKTIDGSFYRLAGLRNLDLQHNEMVEIPGKLFQNSTYLYSLNISSNRLESIAEDAFMDLVFLANLDLSWNRLSNSSSLSTALRGRKLERIELLRLCHNQLTTLPARMFYALPFLWFRLQLLDLSYNQIEQVHSDAFEGLTHGMVLSLSNNRISSFSPGTFSSIPNLVALYVSSNLLGTIPGDLFSNVSHISSIGLDSNRLTKIPTFDHVLLELTDLTLYNNSISTLRQGELQQMPNLRVLDMALCNLSNIEPGSFVHTPHVTQINLAQNHLRLDFSVDIFGQLPVLTSLNLSFNLIGSLDSLLAHRPKYVATLDLSGNPIREVTESIARNIQGLPSAAIETLFLRNCAIRRVAPNSFTLFRFITYLDLSGNMLEEFQPFRMTSANHIIAIEGNPLTCSCRMSWLQNQTVASHYKVSTCAQAVTKAIVPVWSLPRDEFLCENVDSCLIQPKTACRCYKEEDLGPTTYVNCSHGKLTELPKGIPASTKTLVLEGNHFRELSLRGLQDKTQVTDLHLQNCAIERIQPDAFTKIPWLSTLHLQGNLLKNLTTTSFPKMMRYLQLHSNRLEVIAQGMLGELLYLEKLTLHDNDLEFLEPEVMDEMSSLVYLENMTLYGNPWTCPCDNVTFKSWLQDHSNHINLLGEVLCNNTPVISIPDEEFFCYDPYEATMVISINTNRNIVALAVAVTCAIVLLVVLLLGLLAIRHRGVLAVIIYSKLGFRFSTEECEDWTYDAIVMYDGENRQILRWLRFDLLEHLEPQFQLCIPDRDFELGTVESEEVVKRINMSKRSFIVLSENSLENEKLIYMFMRSYYRMTIEDSRHRIFIALSDDFNLEEALDNPRYEENLKAFLKTGEFVRMGDSRFWEKVLYRMPKPRALAEQESDIHSTVRYLCVSSRDETS